MQNCVAVLLLNEIEMSFDESCHSLALLHSIAHIIENTENHLCIKLIKSISIESEGGRDLCTYAHPYDGFIMGSIEFPNRIQNRTQ